MLHSFVGDGSVAGGELQFQKGPESQNWSSFTCSHRTEEDLERCGYAGRDSMPTFREPTLPGASGSPF